MKDWIAMNKISQTFLRLYLKFSGGFMKGFWLFILFSGSILISNIAYGQRIQGAAIVGLNLSQVDGDEVYGFKKAGLNTGLGALVPIKKSFLFNIEVLYNQKGAYEGKQYTTLETDSTGKSTEKTGQYKLNLDYLEIPVLFLYNDRDRIIAGAGFSYGRLVNVKEYEHGQKVETTTLNGGPYSRNDYNVLVDLRFKVYKQLKLNLRYAYSMSKIRTREFTNLLGASWERDQYNNLISFRLIYMFNEKPPLANEKNDDAGF